MIANVTIVTLVLFLVIGFTLLERLRFLAPFRDAILASHQDVVFGFLALLFCNLFGVLFMIYRKFFFKDTGKKLTHLEKQLDSEQQNLITELDRNL
ncbi:MAG: hypothetical protein AB1898_33085 [Acidobacteriota bacterium]